MSLIVKNETTEREKPELGLHDAVCCFVEDVGSHVVKTQYGDKLKHQIVIVWELEQKMEGKYDSKFAGQPFMISKTYTFTLFEKGNLSKDLQSWFSKAISEETRKTGFDLHTLIGRKCQLNLIESEGGQYINIGSVLPASKTNSLSIVAKQAPAWITKKRAVSIEASQQPGSDSGEPLPDPQDGEENPLPF